MFPWQSPEWFPNRGVPVPDDPADWPAEMLEFVLELERYQEQHRMLAVPKSHIWHIIIQMGYRKVAEPNTFTYERGGPDLHCWQRDRDIQQAKAVGLGKCRECGAWEAKRPSPYCRPCIEAKCA